MTTRVALVRVMPCAPTPVDSSIKGTSAWLLPLKRDTASARSLGLRVPSMRL